MENAYASKKRNEVNEKYKWRLDHIFQNDLKWEESFKSIKNMIPEIEQFKGSLSSSSQSLLDCLEKQDEIHKLTDKVYVYAKMKKDEDNSNPVYQALEDRASNLATEVYSSSSYIVPEILSIDNDKLTSFINENSGLKTYTQYIQEVIRQKKHILSDKEEQILAMSSEISAAPKSVFSMLNNADIKFPMVNDEKGNSVELTKGNYIKFLESKDRKVRKEAFKTLYATYSKQKNTLASLLSSNVKSNMFYSKTRNYSSSLESSLDSDNVSSTVYDKLIDTVNNNLPLLHRYLNLRKRVLGVDDLHMYDLYVPLVEEPKSNISYEDSVKIVQDGLKILGNEYSKYLDEGFNSGWIDVFENEGKTSGAYSWGCYLSHPYVLLNHQGTFNDIFTIAHEMGHALHTYFTNKTQPYIYSSYKIFVAEVASTVNEILLMQHMLNNSKDSIEKTYLLNHYLEEFRGTIFRQVMFAEFEKQIHMSAESGIALTTDFLCETYYNLNKKYFGKEVIIDDEISMEWSRIPHFYNSFYVYKYATGFSAATSITEQILKDGEPAIEKYLRFLSSGSSDYPIELLKIANVDLSTPTPVEQAMRKFDQTLVSLEEML